MANPIKVRGSLSQTFRQSHYLVAIAAREAGDPDTVTDPSQRQALNRLFWFVRKCLPYTVKFELVRRERRDEVDSLVQRILSRRESPWFGEGRKGPTVLDRKEHINDVSDEWEDILREGGISRCKTVARLREGAELLEDLGKSYSVPAATTKTQARASRRKKNKGKKQSDSEQAGIRNNDVVLPAAPANNTPSEVPVRAIPTTATPSSSQRLAPSKPSRDTLPSFTATSSAPSRPLIGGRTVKSDLKPQAQSFLDNLVRTIVILQLTANTNLTSVEEQ